MAETLGANFTIDVTQLKAGLAQANRLIRESESEFKAAAAGMGDWTKSQEGLEKRIKSLNDIAGIQEKKVEALKAEYNRLVAEGLDPTSAKATDLRTKINKETEALNKSKAEIEKQTAALEALQAESGDTEKKTETLTEKIKRQESELKTLKERYADVAAEQGKSSGEAKDLAAKIDNLSGELKENKTKLDEASKAADDLDQSLDNAGDSAEGAANGGFTVFKGIISDLASNAIQNLVSSLKDLVGEAVSASDSMYKFEQTMGFAGYDSKTIKQASKDVKDYADRTVYDLNTIANTTAQLAANSVDDYTALTQAAGNLNAVAGGNADTFNSVAMVLTQTAGAGKLTTENWNQLANSIPGASGRLMQAMKDAGAYTGDFREAMANGEITADEFNAALLKLGSEPVAVEAATSTATFEGAMGDLQATAVSGLMDIYNTIGRENITKMLNGISGLIKKIVPPIKAAVQWFIDHLPEIKIALVALTTATAAYLAYTTAVTVMTEGWLALSVAQKAVTAAQAAMNAVMSVNPIGLVVAAVAGLTAAFVMLWNKSEAFRQFWIDLWNNIKDTASAAWKSITGFFSAAWAKIKFVWKAVKPYFMGIWEGIKKIFEPVINFFKFIFETAWAAVKFVWDTVVWYFTNIWNGIKTIFEPVINWFSTKFTAAWNGIKEIWNGASTYFSNIWTNIKKPFLAVGTWFKTKFTTAWDNIKSVFSTVGDFFGGIWDTIKEKFTDIGTKVADAIGGAFKSAINAVIATVEGAINTIPDAINGAIDLINELPGVEISKMPTISLPRLAKGGVVRKATTAIVGEDGAEAVMPLERNTGWIDVLADKLANKIGGGVVVNQTNNYSQAHSRYEIFKSQQATAKAVKLALAR